MNLTATITNNRILEEKFNKKIPVPPNLATTVTNTRKLGRGGGVKKNL